jgi:large subunit ribosomal protein L25
MAPLARAVAGWVSAPRLACPTRGAALTRTLRASSSSSDAEEDRGDVLDVFAREGAGKTVCRHLKRRGMVPGVFFQPGDESGELLSFASSDIERLVRKHGHVGVGSRVLELNFPESGRKEPVVAKQLMLDPSTNLVENVNFMPCAPNTKVKVNVPVRTEGEDASPGVKRGGFPWKVSKHLEVRCLGKDIPPEITIDVSSLDVGDKVFLRDLHLPEMVQVRVKDENIPILKIAGKAR